VVHKHALILDDNSRNVDVLARLLETQGVSSTLLTLPSQLETTIATLSQLDVIFLDLEMPGANGYEVLGWLKSDPRFQHVPIVAYTVHVSELTTAHQHGFDGFLGKPIRYDRFPDQLRRILSGEGVWETA
jgi:two-component system cell cycle response regulator DivK